MALLQELDTGTPIRTGEATVTLTIDGRKVSVPPGTSVMAAAALIDNPVPKLCATDSVEAFGSCRLCLVEIEGRKGTPASCTTPAEAGMIVRTRTPRLERLRRGVMELYISDHPLDCLTCSANNDCELQDQAANVGLRDVRYGYKGANHLEAPTDASNPYFTFESSKCIVCSRCVRACEEVQGTFALTILGRGFDSKVGTGGVDFLSSECVSCGACVQACPTATLNEKPVIEKGTPERTVVTTCAYCGVGCSFKAELKGRRSPPHGPLQGGQGQRRAFVREGPFRLWIRHPQGSHSEADDPRAHRRLVARGLLGRGHRLCGERIQAHPGEVWARLGRGDQFVTLHERGSVPGSEDGSRRVWQQQHRHLCACLPLADRLWPLEDLRHLGRHAGFQVRREKSDVVVVIGANPTDAHPVFASRLKKRLRAGARLIVIDPRRIDLVKSTHVKADHHLALKPGTNVAVLNAMAHVIVTEGLVNEAFVRERCDFANFESWARFVADPRHSPEATAEASGIDPQELRAAARLYATGGNGAIYYGLGVTEHSQGSTSVMAIANLAMATGNIGREGVGVNPLRGQNNVQGSCDMGSFPHEFSGYRHVSTDVVRETFERLWGVPLSKEPGLRIPNMIDEAVDGSFKWLYVQGEDIAQSDPDTKHITAGLRAMECVVVQDLFLNETARYAHVFLPGASFLEKDGTFTNAERRISRVRQAIPPLAGLADWEATMALANAIGAPMHYKHPSEIMDEIAATTPTFKGVSYARLDELGSIQWPCNDAAPTGTPVMHVDRFVRGKGQFMLTEFVATEERVGPRFPLLLTTGQILSQYNVGAQTRRTANELWHDEDVLEIHPFDADQRGVRDGDLVALASRTGEISLHARITERVQPGVVYTTFHHADTGANVVTTDYSDWATNCPEYKVTAVQVRRTNHFSDWQMRDREEGVSLRRIGKALADAAE